MFFLSLISFSQDCKISNWGHFLVNHIDSFKGVGKHEKNYFLVSNYSSFIQEKNLKGGCEIVRVLDDDFAILKSCLDNLSQLSDLDYQFTNYLWKLGDFTVDNKKDTKHYVIGLENPQKVKEQLESLGIHIVFSRNKYIVVETCFEIIEKFVLPLKGVISVSIESFNPKQESNVNDMNLAINGFEKAKKTYPNYFSLETTIGVKDNTPFSDDLDLNGKIINSSLASNIEDAHATDMSTIIAGFGNSGKDGLGVLENAKIFPLDFNDLYPNSVNELTNYNVHIINNSYGTEIENFYGALAFEYDQFVNANRTILPIFSSGNSGLETSESGLYSDVLGFANLTGNFKMAKNNLVVGAVDVNNETLPFSSKGPAYDGRLKPEMVAYSQIGTSNATALVSAAAAVLQQTYFNKFNTKPTTDLIKGFLLNGADDVENPGIDFKTGFGNLNIVESLKILENEYFFQDVLTSNESKSFEISIPENAVNGKVMLIWNDIPASINDNIALKNDLDLTVEVDEEVYFPQILDSSSGIENLEKIATTGEDHLNNVEQILIDNISSEIIKINIRGNEFLTENQNFSILYTWDIANEFEWIFPLEHSNFPYNGGDFGTIKWKSTLQTEENGILQVSFDNGQNWETISELINLSNGFYNWQIDENLHSKAKFRILVNDQIYTSDSFTISSGLQLSTSLNCEDTYEFKWNNKKNTLKYNVYNIQNNELNFVASTVDTSFVFSKNENIENLFIVKPQLISGEETLASKTLNRAEVEDLCYIDFAIGDFSRGKISVNVRLSSLYNIKNVELIKIQDNDFEVVANQESLNLKDVILKDVSPKEGFNTYQVRVTNENGSQFYSNQIELYVFAEENPFLMYPNPLNSDQSLNVSLYSNGFEEAVFELYSTNGVLIYSKKTNSENFLVNFPVLKAGTYIAKISFADQIAIQKLIIK